ncbi:MAG: alpha/beta hydrolase [Betaproteobacteria bacterium]|nr:alpha/beta hydrolase [Betaproteobacteria bacterium]
MNSGSRVPCQWDRVPVILQFAESARIVETYGFSGSQGKVFLEGQRLVPRDRPSDTVYIFMHPSATVHLLPMPTGLAEAGLHVICAASRYPKNDSALIMEKVVYDLGVWVRHAREELGYRRVVLVGWSGGGSLALFYQAEAESPTITQTPAGEPYDLTQAGLQRADGVIFIAAHLSRAETITEWIDPSVRDELIPDDRDPRLDIYSPGCPSAPPFSADFVAAFRAAQVSRNRRITAWVEETLAALRRRTDGEMERAFVVHRTMCDVRWIDPAVDPNGRRPNWCYIGDPRTANTSPAALARYSSLRSWLSQWSYDKSNARGPMNAARVRSTPVLQIENQADDAVPATHNRIIRAALATPDKEYALLDGATHYYAGQPEKLAQCIATVTEWSVRKGLLEGAPGL